jgi:hypothetical protein
MVKASSMWKRNMLHHYLLWSKNEYHSWILSTYFLPSLTTVFENKDTGFLKSVLEI